MSLRIAKMVESSNGMRSSDLVSTIPKDLGWNFYCFYAGLLSLQNESKFLWSVDGDPELENGLDQDII